MNMQYCMFTNTLAEIKKCLQLLDDENHVLSGEELQAASQMFDVMEEMQCHWLSITHRARMARLILAKNLRRSKAGES